MNFPYNPITRRLTDQKIDIDSMALPLTTIENRAIENQKNLIESLKDTLADIEREKRDREEQLSETEASLVTLTPTTPEDIIKKIKRQIKSAQTFQDGLVLDMRLHNNWLYVITNKLSFPKGLAFIDGDDNPVVLNKTTDLGHYLIVIDLLYLHSGTSSIKGVISLDYNYQGYYGPCLKSNEFCWGNIGTELARLLQTGKVIDAIDLIIGFIVSPNDSQGWTRWPELLKDRGSLTHMLKGQPLPYLQSGHHIGFIPNPIKRSEIIELLGILSVNNFRQIATLNFGDKVKNYANNADDVFITCQLARGVLRVDEYISIYSIDGNLPLPLELRPKAATLAIKEERASGLRK
jgi:hypothetical protein